MQNNLQITCNKNGIKTIVVKGSLGLENNKEFQNAVMDLIKSGNKEIILDFSDLLIIDSMGISTLIMLAKIIKKSGGEYIIINCKEQIYSLLEPINLKNLVKIYRKSETHVDYLPGANSS